MTKEINPSRVTIKVLEQMKSKGEKISMLTAYDFSFAKIIDEAGIDIILVGDSASNVMAGHETTLPITLDQIHIEAGGSRYTRIFAFEESGLALEQGHSSNQYHGGSSQISYDSENYGNGIYWVKDETLYYSE